MAAAADADALTAAGAASAPPAAATPAAPMATILSTRPENGSRPSSRMHSSTPARPGFGPVLPPLFNLLDAVSRMTSGTAARPAAVASHTFPWCTRSINTSAARSGSRRAVAATARATACTSPPCGPFLIADAAPPSAALSLPRVGSGSGGVAGAGDVPPGGSGGAIPSTAALSASAAAALCRGSLNARSSAVSKKACRPAPPSPPHSVSAACNAPSRGNPAAACFFSLLLSHLSTSSRHVVTASAQSRFV